MTKDLSQLEATIQSVEKEIRSLYVHQDVVTERGQAREKEGSGQLDVSRKGK